MRSARCVFKGSRRERGHVLLLGLTGKSHLQTVVILTLCWCKNLESKDLAITGGEKMVLVMKTLPLPLHRVSVSVPGSLINFVWTLTVFSSPRRASAVLGPVRFPQIASCLVFHPFFILVYFMPSHVQGWLRVSASVETQLGVLLYHKASAEISRRGLMSSAQSGSVPLGSLPSGVWYWGHCWCQRCPRNCTCCQCSVPSVGQASTQLLTVSLLLPVLGIWGAGMWKQTIKCCPPSS